MPKVHLTREEAIDMAVELNSEATAQNYDQCDEAYSDVLRNGFRGYSNYSNRDLAQYLTDRVGDGQTEHIVEGDDSFIGHDEPTVPQHHRNNFATLIRAAGNASLSIAQLKRLADGRYVTVITAIGQDGDEHTLTPFAVMIDGNPFDQFEPPLKDGGDDDSD